MEWVEAFQRLTEKDKDMFQECANKLLAQSMLVSKKEEDKPYYRFCERHLDIFKEYFLLSGWQLNVSSNRVISLKNRLDRNRLNLTLSESLVLFILRLLYQEKISELSITSNVSITNLEIREKYMALQISKRLPAQDELKRILKLFQKHSIIDLVKGEWGSDTTIITIFDSIIECVTTQTIEEMTKWIKQTEQERSDEQDEDGIEIHDD